MAEITLSPAQSAEPELASPETPERSVLAEYAAEICRRIAAGLVGTAGEDLVELLAAEADKLQGALTDPSVLQGLPPANNPPAFDRKGRVTIATNPVVSHRNALAPPMTLVRSGEECEFRVVLPLQYQGPRGKLHGGYFAVLLDEALWQAVRDNVPGISFTRELTVSYERPVPLFEEIAVTGRVARVEGRKTFAEGEILVGGEVCARAHGLWISPKPRD
jgi:acyl-coenzyme A thioesterase PaaI-like protein